MGYFSFNWVSRNRRPPIQTPGAGAASVFNTFEVLARKLITTDEWNKAKVLIDDLHESLKTGTCIN
jgi:hypothetical protein